MMRPEQIKKFFLLLLFSLWGAISKQYQTYFVVSFFYSALSPNSILSRNIPCSQRSARLYCHPILRKTFHHCISRIPLFSIFPSHQLSQPGSKKAGQGDQTLTQIKIFQPDCCFVGNNFCCSCHGGSGQSTLLPTETTWKASWEIEGQECKQN